MRTEMMQQMRFLLSTEGDTGMLIAADNFEGSDDENNRRFGELLRLYVEIQTLVRMSMAVPVEKSNRYIELNKSFPEPVSEYVGGYGERYSGQLGPFFTEFSGDTKRISQNLDWLENEPVRRLKLTNADASSELAMIFRNHRMQYMTHLEIWFKWRDRRQEGELGRIMAMLDGPNLQEVKLMQVNNRLKIIPAMFRANNRIAKGCSLIIGRDRAVTGR